MIGSAAGSPLQAKGADHERARQDSADQTRQVQAEQRAEMAAGVEQTEQHEHAADRDADGRRLWERDEGGQADGDEAASSEESSPAAAPQSKDPAGETGRHLDLNG
jgi:hypothetical protein